MLLAVMLAACAGIPGGEPEADSDDAYAEEDEAIAAAHDDGSPLAIHLRETKAYLDRADVDAHERRRTLRLIARECRRGVDAAEAELDAGDYGQAMHGLPADCFSRFATAAIERYDVHYHMLGCVIDERSGAFASCYNTVMDRAIATAHGPDVLDGLYDEYCRNRR